MASVVTRFDDAVDLAFEPLRGRTVADWVFYAASETADYSKLWHAIGIGLALSGRPRHALRLAAALGVESVVVNGVLKQVIKRERPPLLDDRAYEVRRPKTASFPSGHASSATMAALLLREAAPKLGPLWVALAVVVAASRTHNRMHHGSDVAAGIAVGAAFAAGAKRLWPLR